MATIMEMLNQGIGGLNTPLGQLGTQLLANSGPQAGNPSGGARLGQALAGMSEMQRAQALQQYREQMIAQQQQHMALQQAQAQAKQEAAQRQKQAMQDPNFLASLTPMARQMAQLGVDPGELIRAQNADNLAAHRQASLAQQAQQFDTRLTHAGGGGQPPGPKQPANRQIYEEPLENNMIQKHIFDPATNSYKPLGKPYQRFAPTKADPMQDLLDQVAPDDNAGTGAAVPGLSGSGASAVQPTARQGADLLTYGGSNPHARTDVSPPSNSTAAGVLSGVTPADGQAVAADILGGVTPRYASPPKAVPSQYPGAPAVGTVRKGFKFLGGNPADPKSWSKV
nr:hypothetical protein [uncultured Pseudomonas sp.]